MEGRTQKIVDELKVESTIFHLFNNDELEKIAPYFTIGRFPAGTTIIREGDPGDFLGLIRSGRVEVKKEIDFEGRQIILAQLRQGAFLGELAMFDEHPRSATVTSIEDSEILILSHEALESFMQKHPAIGIKFLKGICRTLSIRLREAAKRLTLIF